MPTIASRLSSVGLLSVPLVATLAATPVHADPAPRCAVFEKPGSGIVQNLELQEREGRFHLHYSGPMESDIGRYFPMSVQASGRTLQVTIAERSRPQSPSGATLSAFGSNPGDVALPKDLDGVYSLLVRQGKDAASYRIELTKALLRVTEIKKGRALELHAPIEKLRAPLHSYALRCTPAAGCPKDICAQVFALPALADLANLPPGDYLQEPLNGWGLGQPQCNLLIPSPQKRAELEAALTGLRTGVCTPSLLLPIHVPAPAK